MTEAARATRIRELALEQSDGEVCVDADAPVSEGEDNGAFVKVWKWISYCDTDLDKVQNKQQTTNMKEAMSNKYYVEIDKESGQQYDLCALKVSDMTLLDHIAVSMYPKMLGIALKAGDAPAECHGLDGVAVDNGELLRDTAHLAYYAAEQMIIVRAQNELSRL